MSLHERKLVEQARTNPDAFRELYRHYFPRVYAYIAYRVGRVWDAEDLTANIFMKALEGLERFEWRGEGAFAAWLFRIAYSEVSQYYRDRHEHLSLDDLPEIQSSTLAPDQAIARKEQFARLRARIATLSPRRQEIVTLRFFGELRNQEIATVLGLDERTVASHLSRALEDLQRKYNDEEILL